MIWFCCYGSQFIVPFNSLHFSSSPPPSPPLLPLLFLSPVRWWSMRGTATSSTPGVPTSSGLSPSTATPAIYLVSERPRMCARPNTHTPKHTRTHTHAIDLLSLPPAALAFRLAANTHASKCQLYHIFIFCLCFFPVVSVCARNEYGDAGCFILSVFFFFVLFFPLLGFTLL